MRGMNANNTVINSNGLLGIHMPAYHDAVNKGVATVMVSYSSINGLKMHANKKLITGFLKNKLKFRVTIIIENSSLSKASRSSHFSIDMRKILNLSAGHCHLRLFRC